VVYGILDILGYLALAAAGIYEELHQGDQRGFPVCFVLFDPLVNNALEWEVRLKFVRLQSK